MCEEKEFYQAGSIPEIAVNTMPTTTTTIMNFQQVFHHWGKLILHTARPATVMPATGLMAVSYTHLTLPTILRV